MPGKPRMSRAAARCSAGDRMEAMRGSSWFSRKCAPAATTPAGIPEQVTLDARGVAGYQAIIERLVVDVVKSERLQSRLQPPVSLREKQKPGVRFLDYGNG